MSRFINLDRETLHSAIETAENALFHVIFRGSEPGFETGSEFSKAPESGVALRLFAVEIRLECPRLTPVYKRNTILFPDYLFMRRALAHEQEI